VNEFSKRWTVLLAVFHWQIFSMTLNHLSGDLAIPEYRAGAFCSGIPTLGVPPAWRFDSLVGLVHLN
jgi:hypothetical protein